MKKKFELNKGTLQANGLYNIIPKDKKDTRISNWFDKQEYDRLKKLNAEHFNIACEMILTNDDY